MARKKQKPEAAKKEKKAAKAPRKQKEFNLLSKDTQDSISEAMEDLSTRSKKNLKFHAGDIQILNLLKLPVFYLQWGLGCIGLLVGRILEILGPESVGKSSFLYWIFGTAMSRNVPCLYVETERKYTKERIQQFLSTDVSSAAKLLKVLTINQPATVVEMAENIKDWVDKMRKQVKVPMDIPLLVGIDTFSAIQTMYETGVDPAGKAKATYTIGDTKLGDHAKFAAAWMRSWPAYAEENQVILIILSQQKDKVETGFTGVKMSADTGDRFNKTKLGGRAFNFHTTHQMVLLRRGYVRGEGQENIGDRILMEVMKNGIGRPRRQMFFNLEWRSAPMPGSEFQQCPIDFESTAIEWMAMGRMLGIHPVGNNRYTSTELGVKEGTARDVSLAISMNQALVDQLGRSLSIYGYDSSEIPPHVAVAGGQVDDAETDEVPESGAPEKEAETVAAVKDNEGQI